MLRCMLKGNIHHATVTDANVEYEGSITIDAALMDKANLVSYEQVHVWSVTSGGRLETYVIPGEAGSGRLRPALYERGSGPPDQKRRSHYCCRFCMAG